MYYRRKIILALLQVFGGKLKSTDFQKYLFLLCQQQEQPSFDFVPYKYGCFSFQSYADKRTMTKYGMLTGSDEWEKNDNVDYVVQIKPYDLNLINGVYSKYRRIHGNALLKYVYNNFPYYAIHSEVAESLLSDDEYRHVCNTKNNAKQPALFTIGYEGMPLERYLNKLIKENVSVLCDVRKNALSMKYGFSKNVLQKASEGVGIKYVHIPALGIESNKRQKLETQSDYDSLFDDYERTTLPQNTIALEQVSKLCHDSKRVALTCFEADFRHCHRSRVANVLLSMLDCMQTVTHITQ